MAAEIKTKPTQRKPNLIGRVEDDNHDVVTMLVLTPSEEGVITVSEDRSVRIWLKRETGQYWPSVCHFLNAPCSSMCFSPTTKQLFIGLQSGSVEEYRVAEDYNSIYHQRKYEAHQKQVTSCVFCVEKEILVTCAKDRWLTWYWTQNGKKMGAHQVASVPMCLQFDARANYVFCGLSNGEIPILQIDKNDCKPINSLKGHSGAVNSLHWDGIQQILYSASSDKSIIMWDIGSKKGTAFELQGHDSKVMSVHHSTDTQQLVSISYDGSLVIWDMNIKRQETPVWEEKDQCQKCKSPFFWNFRQMWNEKTVGLRQHHCRKCGTAVCARCSTKRSTIPLMGFEFEVRVCDACYDSISEADKAPTATFHELKHNVIVATPDWKKLCLATSGTDRVVKIWDMSQVIHK